MPKACLNCGTDNRDEALFCRRCGTPFSSSQASPSTAEPTMPGTWSANDRAPNHERGSPPVPVVRTPPAPDLPPSNGSSFDDEDDDDEAGGGRTVVAGAAVCPACGFVNQAGAASCGRCGQSLDGALQSRLRSPSMPSPSTLSPSLPPSFSSAGDATIVVPSPAPGVDPAAPSPTSATQASPADDRTRIGSTEATAGALPGSGRRPPSDRPSSRRRAGLWAALAAGVLLLAGLGVWLLGGRSPTQTDGDAASVAATATRAAASAAARMANPEASTASTAPGTALPPITEASPPPIAAASTPIDSAASAAPSFASPAASSGSAASAEEEARAAKLKLERAARAKALRELRDPALAKKAEQDAATQRLAEERARAADSAASTGPERAPVAPPVQHKTTAQEICAGRGMIGTAVCESRQCGQPEHVDEARCRQVNAEEARRR